MLHACGRGQTDLLGSHEALPCRVHVTGAMPPPTTPPPPLANVFCHPWSCFILLADHRAGEKGSRASGLTELGSQVIDRLPTCQLLRSEGLLVTHLALVYLSGACRHFSWLLPHSAIEGACKLGSEAIISTFGRKPRLRKTTSFGHITRMWQHGNQSLVLMTVPALSPLYTPPCANNGRFVPSDVQSSALLAYWVL